MHYRYQRVHVVLRREGWKDNRKRVYRLDCAQGLSLRHKRPQRNKSARLRQPRQIADYRNQIWGMDFASDALFDGRRLRQLTIIDLYTRECLGIRIGQSLEGEDVTAALDRIKRERGTPEIIMTDNGSEFAGRVMDRWAYNNGVEIDFPNPGKPTDNAIVESFNGRLRHECLNTNWFMSLGDAKSKIEDWRVFYNQVRPHPAIEWITPEECDLKPVQSDGSKQIGSRIFPEPGGPEIG